jgi:hypothetical protein
MRADRVARALDGLDFIERDRLVRRVAEEHGLDHADEQYLGDGTEDELRARAAALADMRAR